MRFSPCLARLAYPSHGCPHHLLSPPRVCFRILCAPIPPVKPSWEKRYYYYSKGDRKEIRREDFIRIALIKREKERKTNMKTVVVYYSKHHGNTKKLLDAIAKQGDVTLIEVADSLHVDLSAYDLIGFASGTYYSKLHDTVLQFAEKNLPKNKKVFLVYTYGVKEPHTDIIKQIIDSKGALMLGAYGCLGFDTFGPFKLIGGIAKGHPNDEDIAGVVKFFLEISKQ